MKETELRQILEKAIWAQSGDNTQPWTFEWDGERLHIIHSSQRAEHPLNPQGIASMLALGCLLESIEIAASEFGFTVVSSFSDFNPVGTVPWAEVRFVQSSVTKNPLTDQILKRCTDRRLFRGGALDSGMFQKTELTQAHVHLASKPSDELIQYIVESEQLLVEHPEILPAVMHWVRFSIRDAERTRDGLPWRNLGAKIWELPMMALIRDFPPIVKVAPKAMGPQHRARVEQQLRTSAGIVCVSAPSPAQHRERIVQAGRLMMNAWLSLTQRGYGVQPLTLASTIAFCSLEGLMPLPEKWTRFYREHESVLRRSFSIPSDSSPVWMIRTGVSTPLPAKFRTYRKPLSESLTVRSK